MDNLSEINEMRYAHLFEAEGLYRGRCFGSKSYYSSNHPINWVIFNAQICIEWSDHMMLRIWGGDIDISKDAYKVKKVADALGTRLYVFYENDGFVKYNEPFEYTDEYAWNTSMPKMNLIDRYPEYKMFYEAKQYRLDRITPYGYSAFGFRKVTDIMYSQREMNRFSHNNRNNYLYDAPEGIFCMQDRNNIKQLQRHKRRLRKARNAFYQIKIGISKVFISQIKYHKVHNLVPLRRCSFRSLMNRPTYYENKNFQEWLEKDVY